MAVSYLFLFSLYIKSLVLYPPGFGTSFWMFKEKNSGSPQNMNSSNYLKERKTILGYVLIPNFSKYSETKSRKLKKKTCLDYFEHLLLVTGSLKCQKQQNVSVFIYIDLNGHLQYELTLHSTATYIKAHHQHGQVPKSLLEL